MKKTSSLRAGLIRIIVLCWIVPILLLIIIFGLAIANNVNGHIVKTASNLVFSAADVCTERIDFAIDSSRYASYNTSLKQAYDQFQQDEDYVQLYQNVDTFLVGNYKFDDKFVFTYMKFYDLGEGNALSNREFYTFNEALLPDSKTETGRTAYRKIVEQDGEDIMKQAQNLSTSIGFVNRGGHLYIVRNLFFTRSDRPTAYLAMRLNTEEWFDTVTDTPWSTDVVLQLNSENLVVRGDKLDIEAVLAKYKSEGKDGSHHVTYGGNTYFCAELFTGDYVFSYAVAADKLVLMQDFYMLRNFLVLLVLLTIPLFYIVIRFFRKNINRPLEELERASVEIEKGNIGFQAENTANNLELTRLTNSFNSMSAKLEEQFEQIYREELALRDAKISALQSQINPHFLGNTLEIINWEARLGNTEKVSKMIEALSTMLDAALDRNNMPVVHLSEELMYVDAYLYIIKERFGKRLIVNKEIDASLLETYVPRLILQPIIENSVEHGVSPNQHGVINIRIYAKDEYVCLDIENDGKMTQEQAEKVERILSAENIPEGTGASHVGIRNVLERLKIIYGDESSLTIRMTNENTVLAKIIIPFGQTDKEMQ